METVVLEQIEHLEPFLLIFIQFFKIFLILQKLEFWKHDFSVFFKYFFFTENNVKKDATIKWLSQKTLEFTIDK